MCWHRQPLWGAVQKELAETKAQRLEVEASAQDLATTLDSDLERRRVELEDALSAADAGVTKCGFAQTHSTTQHREVNVACSSFDLESQQAPHC